MPVALKNVIPLDTWREKELPEKFKRDVGVLIQRGLQCEQGIPRRSCDKSYIMLRDHLDKRVVRRIAELLRGKIPGEHVHRCSFFLAGFFVDLLREPKVLESAVDPIVYSVGDPWKLQLAGGVCLLLAGMFTNPWGKVSKTREIELYTNRAARFYWMLAERIKTLPEYMRSQTPIRQWLSRQRNARHAGEIFADLLYFPLKI